MLTRNANGKTRFMRFVSQMMAVLLVIATVITVSPGVTKAAAAPRVTSATATVSNNSTTITVAFNVYANPSINLANLKNNVQIKRSGATTFSDIAVDNASNEISLSNDGKVVITLSAALTGKSNGITVKAGSVMNESDVSSTFDVTVSNIVGLDVAPAFTGSYVNNNGGEVLFDFDENIIINNGNLETAAFLRSKIRVAVDGVNFTPLSDQAQAGYGDCNCFYLQYNNDMKIVLGLNTLIEIASGTIKDSTGNLNAEMIVHVTPPIIQSAIISDDAHDVTISFQESVVDNTYYSGISNLRGQISLLVGPDSVRKNLVEGDTADVVLGKLKLHFVEALRGANNQIKINSNALKGAYGNFQAQSLLTPLIQASGDDTAPVYLDYYLSNSNHDLNLVFDEDIENAAIDVATFIGNAYWYTDACWGCGLPVDSSVTFSGQIATIHFASALSASQYLINFNGNSFKDTSGNVLYNAVSTNWIYPSNSVISYNKGYFSHDGRWLSLEYGLDYDFLIDNTIDEDGKSHLNTQITISTDKGLSTLDPLDVVSVNGDKINIFFHEAKKEGSIKVKVPANSVISFHQSRGTAAIDAVVAHNTPDITGYIFSNSASEFVFADNAAWSSKVKDVYVYENCVYRHLNSSEYSVASGRLTINKGVFQENNSYQIYVEAEGFSTEYFEGYAFNSNEIFYMTAPSVTAKDGITAEINIFRNINDNNYYSGTQTVIFELMNGTTPVFISASDFRVMTGTYKAIFSVAYNSNYTVRAYVVNKYNNDPTTVGVNMATVKTQTEIDQAMSTQNNNNNNMP